MSIINICLKCNNTGVCVDGASCDCNSFGHINVPLVLEVPSIYQETSFTASLVPINMPKDYGIKLEDIINEVKSKGRYSSNILICSPPNTGKTVFAYTLYISQYSNGISMPEIIDLIEARELLMSNSYDESVQMNKEKLFSSPLAVIKIPLDLPNKFSETISTILERRIRKKGNTIFLYGSDFKNLVNQDRYGSIQHIIKDGSYNSLLLLNYFPKEYAIEGIKNNHERT